MSNPVISTYEDSDKIRNQRNEAREKEQAEKDKNMSFFERQKKDYRDNPASFSEYNKAVNDGDMTAFAHQANYRNHLSPGHNASATIMKAHNYDFNCVRMTCINAAINTAGAKQYQFENKSYETAILDAIRPSPGNEDDAGMVRKAKSVIQDKWDKRGYLKPKDDEVMDQFLRDNKLSTGEDCRNRIAKIVDAHFGTEKLLAALDVANRGSVIGRHMAKQRAEIAVEDNKRRDAKRDREAQEAARRGEFVNRK